MAELKPLNELHREMYLEFRKELDKIVVPLLFNDEDFGIQNVLCDGKIVGIFCTVNHYIDCIYIQPKYRRRGLAKEVVLNFVKRYMDLGLRLHIINNNEPAKAFWNSLFELEKIEINPIDTLYEIVSIKGGAE